jgi:alpha-tubulin suppressor-like RCC1 family protein
MPRRSMAYVLLLCCFAACTTWHVKEGASPLLLIATEHPSRVRVTRSDSSDMLLQNPRIAWAVTVASVGADTQPRSQILFSLITSGTNHTCALASDSAAYCWGLNNSGELGAPSKDMCKDERYEDACAERPIPVSGGLRFTAVVVGQFHSCGLSNVGRAYCWGSDFSGQLGADSGLTVCHEPNGKPLKCASTPVPVAGSYKFVLLVTGGYHTCGLTTMRVPYCWGLDDDGQLGSDSLSPICGDSAEGGRPCRRTPVRVEGDQTFTELAAGRYHTCGLDAQGQAWCWGRGFGTKPSMITGAPAPFASISASDHKTCALTSEGVAFCWGIFRIGPSDMFVTLMTPTLGGTWQASSDTIHLTSMTTGEEHICGLTPAHAAYCWGVGWDGQLGISRGLFGKLGKQGGNDPLPVEGKLQFVVLSAGFAHTCGVANDGRAYCWGANKLGQLGDGTTKGHDKPRLVADSLP